VKDVIITVNGVLVLMMITVLNVMLVTSYTNLDVWIHVQPDITVTPLNKLVPNVVEVV
jgi:hypothetical protein